MIVALVVTKKEPAVTTRDGGRIRCPKCEWEPSSSDRWYCDLECDHSWNTFETRGRCPKCGKQWTETACLRCHVWSPHDDWYETSPNL
jgi:hypothetical protein